MKPALGKGLSALIPDKGKEKEKSGEIFELDIKTIIPNEYQPRRIFDDTALKELVASIKEKGIIQPVIVRKSDKNSYQLIDGERRCRDARHAGMSSNPAIVKKSEPS